MLPRHPPTPSLCLSVSVSIPLSLRMWVRVCGCGCVFWHSRAGKLKPWLFSQKTKVRGEGSKVSWELESTGEFMEKREFEKVIP